MFRACLVGFACWVAVGSFGLMPSAVRGAAGSATTSGFVTEPCDHDTLATEGKPLAWAGLVEHDEPRPDRTHGRQSALAEARLSWRFTHTPPMRDVRSTSRMGAAATRAVDLRRDAFRIRPGRRAGGVEPAPGPFV